MQAFLDILNSNGKYISYSFYAYKSVQNSYAFWTILICVQIIFIFCSQVLGLDLSYVLH